MTVITDWLDVTYAPDDVPEPAVRSLLLGCGFDVAYDTGGRIMYCPPKGGAGSVVITYASRYGKISLSGGACAYLRAQGHWHDVLFELSTSPHKVTRLDAAYDVRADAAGIIAALTTRYPSGEVSLGRKALPVKRLLEVRPDGKESGTFYVGHKTYARATARGYDKRLERLQRAGIDIGHELTRFEVTARKDYGATLRDAMEPEAIFWHIASPALFLHKPKGVAKWMAKGDLSGWEHVPKVYDTFEVLQRRVRWCAELEALALLADDLGPHGRNTLLNLLAQRIQPSEASEAV